MRAREGGADIPVVIGDFRDVEIEGRFSLVFVLANTLFMLLSQEDQVTCFRNVSEHLTDGGAGVVDTDSATIDVERYDALNQRVFSQSVWLTESGVRMLCPFGSVSRGRRSST